MCLLFLFLLHCTSPHRTALHCTALDRALSNQSIAMVLLSTWHLAQSMRHEAGSRGGIEFAWQISSLFVTPSMEHASSLPSLNLPLSRHHASCFLKRERLLHAPSDPPLSVLPPASSLQYSVLSTLCSVLGKCEGFEISRTEVPVD
ncbi:hypothetical protein BCV69DRAFT_164794 [Microstroma glucosiphilum]|uniref:Secreted protein n=1 Tax=Pseudomicrostroma glucosiphilum TaxID=1684307 RepID=A0A316UDV8_9BASI|nr:hypothetical protein BCV69DRAFT_164794 [Pseudomicrostroma glucosiphilum]PWN21265.1 hypothetical protein BCV69DRAFT_164794 [Pseudomicrostroma glucosiphilum]